MMNEQDAANDQRRTENEAAPVFRPIETQVQAKKQQDSPQDVERQTKWQRVRSFLDVNEKPFSLLLNFLVVVAGIWTLIILGKQTSVMSTQTQLMGKQTDAMLKQTRLMAEQLADSRESSRKAEEQSRASLEASAASLEASAAQNKAGLDSTIERARMEQRAWVGVIEMRRSSEPKLGERLLFNARLSNSGRTPATEVLIHKDLSFEYPIASNIDPHHAVPERSRFAISPGATFITQSGTIPLIQPMLDALIKKRPLYLYGTIHYRDVFYRQWSTTFCSIYVFQQQGDPGLEFCPSFNDMKVEQTSR